MEKIKSQKDIFGLIMKYGEDAICNIPESGEQMSLSDLSFFYDGQEIDVEIME